MVKSATCTEDFRVEYSNIGLLFHLVYYLSFVTCFKFEDVTLNHSRQTMSGLLSTIEKLSSQAASALKEADYLSDADIRILTRQDLNELLPGPKNLILRKKIFDSIQEHEPINGPSRGEDKVFPEESSKTALKEILSDNLSILQNLKTSLHNAQSPLDAQYVRLLNIATAHQESDITNTDDDMETSTGGVTSSNVNDNSQSSGILSIAEVKQYLSQLHEADYLSDADIKILTPQDLNELRPGPKNLKLRKQIFDSIQEHLQETINGPSRGGDKVFPEESSKTDLKEILFDILQNLRTSFHNVQSTLDAQSLLLNQLCKETPHQESGTSNPALSGSVQNDHDHPQGAFGGRPNPQGSCTGIMDTDDAPAVTNPSSDNGKSHGTNITKTVPLSGTSNPALSGSVHNDHDHPQGAYGGRLNRQGSCTGIMETDDAPAVTNPSSDNGKSHGTNITDTDDVMETSTAGVTSSNVKDNSQSSGIFSRFTQFFSPTEVKYKMVVSGKTFGAHEHFMKKVEDKFQGRAQLIESNDDHQVTILFCPIISRMVTDIQAAMAEVKDDKPIVLVMMHHSHEPKVTPSVRQHVNDVSTKKIVLHANVFFHETLKGLVQCQENDTAASLIQNKLLEYSLKKTDHTSGQGNMEVEIITGAELFSMPHHPEVKYKMFVSGKTFGAHEHFMKKVEDKFQGRAQLIDSNDDHQVTILFCPIVSRMVTDIQAAMADVKDDKPIVLVMMHHSHEPKVTRSVRQQVNDVSTEKIVVDVSVFFHETLNGLVQCQENDTAASVIQKELQKYISKKTDHTSGQSNMEVKNRRTGEEPFTMLHHPEALRYKMVVSGQTFGAHQQFMKKVEDQFRGRAQHIESNDDHQVTILFCPMISHMGSDIQAAMAKMEDEKHILLVSMHHSLGPTVTPSTRTWVDYPNIKLHVNVFFHETQNGLIMCHENDDSVSAISNELQKFCPLRNEDTTEQNNQGTTVAKKAKSDGEGSDKQSFLGFSLPSFSKKKK
ncbi:uncharacterized protein LOC117824654 isoform X3 [Xyrichtys novacula]|uniref:Uncharacterized protein LOC117824654 isoform X3 n=1 Tax=Xyrichtys novacula TaxID=13765 RepID=A0AAV1GXS1_XYRNO|nr:uncharacterized protein LOC117824654 isoform X3 [Xyrichtys novacula]